MKCKIVHVVFLERFTFLDDPKPFTVTDLFTHEHTFTHGWNFVKSARRVFKGFKFMEISVI